jgi:hypothetical protein
MSEADKFPDPDLSFLEGTTGEDIAAVGVGLDEAAQQLDSQIRVIEDSASGTTVDQVQESLVAIKKGLEAAASEAGKTAQAFDLMKQAWETWKANAPRQAAIAFAERSLEDARQRLRDADDDEAWVMRIQLKYAEVTFNEMRDKREAADTALAAALDRAKDMLPSSGPILELPIAVDGTEPAPPAAAPGPVAKTPAAPGSGAPGTAAAAPPSGLPGAGLPGATLPPGTGLSAMPETAGAATGSGLSPAQAGALAAALGQQQQQPQAQAAPPMPQMPTMPQQQPPKQNPLANSGINDPNALLAALAAAAPAAALAGVGAPAMSSTIASPALTPLNTITPPNPTFTPLNPTGLVGASPANPVVQPVVTGTSTAGLTTDNNVTGRPDGAAARTATSPSPASHLASGGAETAATRPGGMGTGAGMGAPMMPMGMPMNGGMNGMGGAGKDREPVTADQNSDFYLLSGGAAIGEAVPGGTIARKED